METKEVIALAGWAVAALSLLLSYYRSNRDSHSSAEERGRREARLEERLQSTIDATGRIEAGVVEVNKNMTELVGEFAKLTSRVNNLEQAHRTLKDDVDDLQNVMQSFSDMALKERKQ